jgi:hypothetical protein
MMDHERREKELQEVFEKIQHSYKTLVDNTLMLQERTLELAKTLFESSAEKTHGTQAKLVEMTNQSRSQREEFEELRGSVNRRVAYVSRHNGNAVESL